MEKRLNVSIDTVFNCVIPYIRDGDDRNSVSLVCRKWCELEGVTRKHVTVHLFYSPKPSRLHQRFPFLESLTLKGLPRWSLRKLSIDITPWIHEISVSFKCLKSLCIRCMYVGDSDLELLARTRGNDLRVLKIIYCHLSTDGLLHIGKCCNDLRTLCLKGLWVHEKDGKWLHELALQNTGIESLDFSSVKKYDVKDLILLAKNCSQSLVSLKLRSCDLIDLVDVFRYVVRLEDFVVSEWDNTEEYGGFKFPSTMRCTGIHDSDLNKTWLPLVLPLAHQLRELYLEDLCLNADSRCFLIQRCPNMEILYIKGAFGDMGLKLLGQFCKKLRSYKTYFSASHIGLIALAQGCLALECLHVNLTHITIEAMKCIGTHLKNLRDFCLNLTDEDSKTTLPLDNGIQAMLIGCGKLERLGFHLCPGGLTDVGLGYIGKYGHNLRYLSLNHAGESDAGLVELSKGCPKLRKLEIDDCPFSGQAIDTYVFNMHSLRYMRVSGITGTSIRNFEMTRPSWSMLF